MENEKTHVSRRVRIKFKTTAEVIEGNIVFENTPKPMWDKTLRFTWFVFRFNDDAKTEKLYNMMNVDTIDYLAD